MQTVPVGTLAKLLLLTERRIQQLAKEGVIPKGPRGEYELVPSVQGYIRFLQEESRQGVGGSPEMADSKTRLAKAKADDAEMKVLERRKQLVWANEVVVTWAGILTLFKTRMRSIPSEFAPRVRMAKTDGQAQKLLQQGIDAALNELANADIKIKLGDPNPAGLPEE